MSEIDARTLDAVGPDASSKSGTALAASYAVLLGAGYYLAARVGLGFRFQHSQIGVVWAANALVVAALVLSQRKHWWMILTAAAMAHAAAVGDSVPAWRVLWQIAGNLLFGVATVEVLRRAAGFPLGFDSRRQVLIYTAVSFLMPALFAFTTPAVIRSVFEFETGSSPAEALARTTLSNGVGLLFVGPVVLLWASYGRRHLEELRARRLAEAAVVVASVLGVGIVAFGTGPEVARFPSLLLWVFPPLLWAAIRFGPLGANTSLFLIGALSVWGTARQLGPFVHVATADRVLSLQLFWIVLCPTIMLVAAVIREREQAEEALQDQRNQLAHATRLATAGELSGVLAHELRQPLTSIRANAEAAIRLLAREPANVLELREILEDIERQDEQAAGIVSGLRGFLKEGESRFERLEIENVVHDALSLGRGTLAASQVDVQTQVAGWVPSIRGDRIQLLQVVLNLIVNGCEAMSQVPERDRRLSLQIGRIGRGQVELVIADNGVGLPGGNAERVFKPFFTTKDSGLGLGLAIGRSIATAHGGRLWAENKLPRGSTFHLVLPAESARGAERAR